MSIILGKIYNRVSRILSIRFLYDLFIKPNNTDPDTYRKEYVLNTILVGILGMLAFLTVSVIWSYLIPYKEYSGIPLLLFTAITSYFITLLILSRKGYWFVSSIGLIATLFVATTYAVIVWSFVVPMIILGSVLIIVISGILFSGRTSIIITTTITVILSMVTYLQIHGYVPVNMEWKNDPLSLQDVLDMGIIFFLVNGLAWLSNRETRRSLERARASEQALIIERNLLEERVEERTRELKNLQARQVAELQHLADFGDRSSGIFHDLMTPLTSITALIDQLPDRYSDRGEIKPYLEKAVRASKKIGEQLALVRKELKRDPYETCNPSTEINDAIDILSHRARMMNIHWVALNIYDRPLAGNPVVFHRILINLLTNAIDAYESVTHEDNRDIIITCTVYEKDLVLKVQDFGSGIPKQFEDKIFEPFFTTKQRKGLGVGLSHTKHIIENYFNGTITFTTSPNGTTFTVTIPLH